MVQRAKNSDLPTKKRPYWLDENCMNEFELVSEFNAHEKKKSTSRS